MRFCLAVLVRLSQPDQLGIRLALEESTSKYFPVSNSAEEVRDRLAHACRREGVQLRYGAGISTLGPGPEQGLVCGLEGGESISADRVVSWLNGLPYGASLSTKGCRVVLSSRLRACHLLRGLLAAWVGGWLSVLSTMVKHCAGH